MNRSSVLKHASSSGLGIYSNDIKNFILYRFNNIQRKYAESFYKTH